MKFLYLVTKGGDVVPLNSASDTVTLREGISVTCSNFAP